MAKVKSIVDIDQIRLYGTLDSNLNGTYFNNTASQTIFSFGKFVVTSNFEGRRAIDYSNTLSSFVRPVTLETMGLTETQTEIILKTTTEAVLNLDKSDLNTFVRFGSAYEFLRTAIQNIILEYPASIFANSRANIGGNSTVGYYDYNPVTNISFFKVPINVTVNTFGIICNRGNTGYTDSILRNLNLSYKDYIIWSPQNPTGNSYNIIEFTGHSSGNEFLTFKVRGNPFPTITGGTMTSGRIDFHIKPNNKIFEEFRARLTDYEKYIVSERLPVNGNTRGFTFMMKDPTLLDDGNIIYANTNIIWNTADGYNIDISGSKYRTFLETILNIGSKYDSIKTDLIARFLTPLSLKTYDLTEEGKMTKLLRLYGREFDELRQFIDSLVNINRVTYDKINNIPDQLVRNLARTFGWNYFSLVNENELVESFLTISDEERNLHTDLMPAEIDIELWRRILINTNYFWKSKGTREAIKSMFLLIGIPEPFINITEYVYTVDGKINPNTVELSQADFPSNSLPYDSEGYPIAPLETNEFYFQVAGDIDSGQAYMDCFRMAGFNLMQTVDNKKSWVQAGATTRIDDTTPQYYQGDSRLVLNTKEVDVSLDTARGIEFDVFDYIKNTDFPANSSGYTLPYSYVNISLGYTGEKNAFKLPAPYDATQGDLEVRYNGILLNGQKMFDTGSTSTYFMDAGLSFTGISENSAYIVFTGATGGTDYIVSGDSFIITNENYAINSGNRRDVIQATFMYKNPSIPMTGSSVSGISVNYMVTRIGTLPNGSTTIPLPSTPRGDVQVTINGIALTKGTGQFNADYIVDAANNQLIIQNPNIAPYLKINPHLQVAYLEVIGSDSINLRSEILRVDSFSTGKFYYNSGANKNVYKLNYKVNKASDLKVLIDGIALEPNKDYTLNSQNPYEIYLPKGIKYGTVITVYYLVGGNDIFFPVVADNFGVGDISRLSFLEFIELIQRRMINAKNRKTISDFKGGWYPTLLNVYLEYLRRSELADDNPLLSNGYTFQNLYSFLSKYNAFFQRFVDQLLSATIILRKGGLMVRNSVFTKQKFTYKRGVNLYADGSTTSDMRGRVMYQYLGNDGSEFAIAQEDAPVPIVLHVDTISGASGTHGIDMGYIQNTGGVNISGHTIITEYGMEYKRSTSGTWCCSPSPLCTIPLSATTYPSTITGLTEGVSYDYRAVVKAGTLVAYGNTLSTLIPETVIVAPSAITCMGTMGTYSIDNTGGIVVPPEYGADVEWYGMQYRPIGTIGEFGNLCISPTALTFTSDGGVGNITICGNPANTFTISIPFGDWAYTQPPEPPSPLGIPHQITVCPNTSGARSTVISYSAVTNCVNVLVSQEGYVPPAKTVCLCQQDCTTGMCCAYGQISTCPAMSVGECYSAAFCYKFNKPATPVMIRLCVRVTCNSNLVYNKILVGTKACLETGALGSMTIRPNDTVCASAFVMAPDCVGIGSLSQVALCMVTPIPNKGNFVRADVTSITYRVLQPFG